MAEKAKVRCGNVIERKERQMPEPRAWHIFTGNGRDSNALSRLPVAPPWRKVGGRAKAPASTTYQVPTAALDAINAALYLRRPLLVTGAPGVGKTTLADKIAYELRIESTFSWRITSRTTLGDGLYSYDAISRLRDEHLNRSNQNPNATEIGKYLRLQGLGSAIASIGHSLLLIDELDKCDIDLPGDLLHVLEENAFSISELERIADYQSSVSISDANGVPVIVTKGRVTGDGMPFIIMASNEEREFPPAFLRRCVRLKLDPPSFEELLQIARQYVDLKDGEVSAVARAFIELQKTKSLSTDQFLHVLYMISSAGEGQLDRKAIKDILLHDLSTG